MGHSGKRSAVVPIRARAESDAELSDEALAHAAIAGDPEALARLFDRLQGVVAAFVGRMVGGRLDVDDLVQTTFLTIATGKARFDGRSAARSWVLGIALNHTRRQLRSSARRARLARALAPFTRSSGDAEARIHARRDVHRVQAALDALPVMQRAALLLTELHGLDAREAALALGATEAAVWKAVSRARAALRAALAEDGGDDA